MAETTGLGAEHDSPAAGICRAVAQTNVRRHAPATLRTSACACVGGCALLVRDFLKNLHDYKLGYFRQSWLARYMPTRRHLLHLAALPLLPQSAVVQPRSDLALLSDYARCAARTADLYARRDKAEGAMWKRREESCPIVDECDERLVVLWDEMNAIIRRSVTQPAQDLSGVVAKMAVWRAETLLLGHRLELQRDMIAFGAYQDLLRLSGMSQFAHASDSRTLAKALLWDGE